MKITIWKYLRTQIYLLPVLIIALAINIPLFLLLLLIYAVYCLPDIIIVPIALLRALKILENIDAQRKLREANYDDSIKIWILIFVIAIILVIAKFSYYTDPLNYIPYQYRNYYYY